MIALIGFYMMSIAVLGSGAAFLTALLSLFQGEWRIAGLTAFGSCRSVCRPFSCWVYLGAKLGTSRIMALRLLKTR